MAALASLLLAQSAFAQDFETINYNSTATGPTRILNGWACWFPKTCEFASCHMNTVRKPSLGTLKVTAGPSTISMEDSPCRGRPITALFITYTPRRGAHGSDEVVLRSIADNGGRHILDLHIEVP